MNGFEPTLIDLMEPVSSPRTPLPSSSFESVFTCTSFSTALKIEYVWSRWCLQGTKKTHFDAQETKTERTKYNPPSIFTFQNQTNKTSNTKEKQGYQTYKRQRIMLTSFSSMSRVLPPPPPSSVAAAVSAAAATAVLPVVSSISSSSTGTNESYYDDGGEEEETEGN